MTENNSEFENFLRFFLAIAGFATIASVPIILFGSGSSEALCLLLVLVLGILLTRLGLDQKYYQTVKSTFIPFLPERKNGLLPSAFAIIWCLPVILFIAKFNLIMEDESNITSIIVINLALSVWVLFVIISPLLLKWVEKKGRRYPNEYKVRILELMGLLLWFYFWSIFLLLSKHDIYFYQIEMRLSLALLVVHIIISEGLLKINRNAEYNKENQIITTAAGIFISFVFFFFCSYYFTNSTFQYKINGIPSNEIFLWAILLIILLYNRVVVLSRYKAIKYSPIGFVTVALSLLAFYLLFINFFINWLFEIFRTYNECSTCV